MCLDFSLSNPQYVPSASCHACVAGVDGLRKRLDPYILLFPAATLLLCLGYFVGEFPSQLTSAIQWSSLRYRPQDRLSLLQGQALLPCCSHQRRVHQANDICARGGTASKPRPRQED